MLISLFRSADEIPGKPSSLAYMPINDHFGSLFSSFRNTFLAYLAVFYLHPGGQDYPVRVVKFRNFNSWSFMVSWEKILRKRYQVMQKFLNGRGRSGFFGGTFWERSGCVAFGSGFYTFRLGGQNFLNTNSQKVIPQSPKWDEIFLSPFK